MSVSPSTSRALARVVLFGALALLGPGACRSTAPLAAGRETSTLRLENHGGVSWGMELAPDVGGAASRDMLRWEIPPHGKQDITVPAGLYHLRSRLADEANQDAPAAFEKVLLLPGATQVWPLPDPAPLAAPAP